MLSDSQVIIFQQGEISNTNLLNYIPCDKIKTWNRVWIHMISVCHETLSHDLTLCSGREANNFDFGKT